MTQYVSTPEGYIGFPDDMGTDEITKALDGRFKPKGPELGPFGASKENFAADVETIYGRGAQALGFSETAKRNINSAEARRKAVEENYKPKVADWRDIGKDGGIGNFVGDLGQFAYEQGAGMLPYMGATAAGAAAGALAAPAIGLGGITAGVLGGTLAGTVPFTGQMISEQMKEGVPFEKTNLPLAVGAGTGAALLDTVLGRFLPGVGKAASGGILLRFAKKGLEGIGVEGGAEVLQEAITIGQANPEKLFSLPPEVQKRLIDAAVVGGMFGGAIGGVSGAMNPRGASPSPTADEPYGPFEPYGPPAPPPEPMGLLEYKPNMTEYPNEWAPQVYPAGRHDLDPTSTGWGEPKPAPDLTPQKLLPYIERPDEYPNPYAPQVYPADRHDGTPDSTGYGGGIPQPPPGGLPPGSPPPGGPSGPSGGPSGPAGPQSPAPPAPPPVAPAAPPAAPVTPSPPPPKAPAGKKDNTGQQVFDHIAEQLRAVAQQEIAAGQKASANPIQINAMAKIWRDRYETLARLKGTTAFDEYKLENLSVQYGGDPNAQPEVAAPPPKKFLKKPTAAPATAPELSKTQFFNNEILRLQKKGVKDPVAEATKTTEAKYPTKTTSASAQTNYPAKRPSENDNSYYDRVVVKAYNKGMPLPEAKKFAEAATDHHWPRTTLKQDGDIKGPQEGLIEDRPTWWANFKRWAKGAPLVERPANYRGGPAVFKAYHGTTYGNIKRVNSRKGDKTGALGQGFYVSTNPRDASANYGTRESPDAVYRVNRRTSEIDDYLANLPKEERAKYLSEYLANNGPWDANSFVGKFLKGKYWPEALLSLPNKVYDALEAQEGNNVSRQIAEKEIFGDTSGVVMPIYVRVNNPMDMRTGGTNFTGREYTRLIKALNDLADSHPNADVAGPVNILNNQYQNTGNVSAKDVYDIIKKFGHVDPDPEFGGFGQLIQDLAKELNYDGLIQQAGQQFVNMEEMTKDTLHVVPFNDNQIKSQFNRGTFDDTNRLLKQNPDQKTAENIVNAEIELLPNSAIIRLYKAANVSSFMHESAHLWLRSMEKNFRYHDQIRADLQTIRDWVGNKGEPFTTAQHEKFARGFELFLYSGRGPTAALTKIFKQFATWLKGVYAKASDIRTPDGKSIEVPEHIMQVYERMFYVDKKTAADGRVSRVSDADPLPISGVAEKFNAAETPKQTDSRLEEAQRLMDKAAEIDADRRKSVANGYANRGRAEEMAREAKLYRDQAQEIIKETQSPTLKQTEDADGMESPATASITLQQAAQQTPGQNPTSIYAINKASWKQNVKRKVEKFFNPFSEISNPEQYRDLRNLLGGSQYAATEQGTKYKNLFAKLTPAQKESVNTYFDTPNADTNLVPSSIRADTIRLKNYINGELKQKLIDNNLLPESVAEKNVDSYLPRLYLKYLLDASGIKGSGIKANLSWAKKRSSKSPEELLAMGDIKDPGVRTFHAIYRTQRDLAVMDFLNKVSQNADWALPQSLVTWNGKRVTAHWLKKEAADIRADRIKGEPDPIRKEKMKAIADDMDRVADEGIDALERTNYDQSKYTKLPDSYDYGPLRGMIVQNQIAEDIIGTNNFVNPDNTWDNWFGDRGSKISRLTSLWKTLKVPLNPPSQMRNVASNMILLHLSGVPIHKLGTYMVRSANDMRADGKYFKIAKEFGVGNASMTEQELFAISEELQKLEANKQNGFAGWRAVYRGLLKGTNSVTDFYQKLETWGKIAKIMHAMETKTKEHPNGMSAEQAVREANKWLFDYSEVDPFVRRARQSPIGMPFLTFSYKIIPLMYEVMTKHPTRMLPYVALAATVPALVASSNDIDEEDEEKVRKSLSPGLRRKDNMFMLPWKDANGKWQLVDVGYFLPWQMPYEMTKSTAKAGYNLATGDSKEAISNAADVFKASTLLSNPLFNIVSALTTGVDAFTGKPIADKRDPANKQVMDVTSYAWSLVVPSFLASYGALGQLINKESGTGLNRYGEPGTTYGQMAARAVGINTYSVDPAAQRARNIRMMQHDLREVKSRMTTSLSDRSLTPEQRRKVTEDFREELIYRSQQLAKYAKETEMSPRLREATARP